MREGEGVVPKKGDKVTVHYEGRLEDGSVFDSSYERDDKFTITIGVGQVIKGWDEGIMTMKVGEKADLVIKSDYGYGDSGSPPKIPGGATLIFTVEVFNIEKDKSNLSDEDCLAEGQKQKDAGNAKFKEKKHAEALTLY